MAIRLPVEIDGSRGEGGGQVLRTALALALIARRKLRIRNIRANRRKPGLQPQHLACVIAAARLCNGRASGPGGAQLSFGSTELEFVPGDSTVRVLDVDIGTAGSTSLLLQTVLLPALLADAPVRIVVTGGTHNPLAPPFEFLERVVAHHLRAMGATLSLTLERHGMMPRGGGRVVVETTPSRLTPIEVVDAGPVIAARATAIIASLPRHVGERELAVARERLTSPAPACELRDVGAIGPHNVFMAEVELASGARELVTAQGERGYPAEDVADDAFDALDDFVAAGVPVGAHLADQLVLPLALAGGGRFRTLPLSLHATTNIDTIREFLDVPIRWEPTAGGVEVQIG